MPELEAPTRERAVKKSDLLGIKTIEQLSNTLFPERLGFQHKAKRGPENQIIVVIDDLGNELHIHEVEEKPKKSDYTARGGWSRQEKYKFYFQPGRHLLVLGKDSDMAGDILIRHTRADWTKDGLSRSFVDALKKLEYGNFCAFDDLLERKEVTNRFYEEWVEQVRAITKAVVGVPEERRSEIGRLVTQRLLFLHFIQTKNLLDGNQHYMLDLARINPKDTYHAFKHLFFQCLNREGEVKDEAVIPYLNGGLFRETDLELAHRKYTIADGPFVEFLKFLGGGRWNWHLDEYSDDANALDPALLGHIFEKSVNQKEMGAFYTPRSITRYMSEQGIWGYLASKLDPPAKPNELADRMAKLPKAELLKFIKNDLAPITVMDNACGSGAFLLAGLDVLREVWKHAMNLLPDECRPEIDALLAQAGRATDELERSLSFEYKLTKWLVSKNIYGVDIEPGAVEIARLRLWLALITHAPDNPILIEPLPNIDYNLRCGNSLMGFTKPEGSLAVLDDDCTDLLQGVIVAMVPVALRGAWEKGALLNDALKLRAKLVDEYRFANQARYSRELDQCIKAFDARVGGRIEALWEGLLLKKLSDKKGSEATAKEWMKEYRRLRDDTIRPFHWYLEFPTMMQQGGACVIITNPPWQRVKAERRIFHKQWWPEITNENKYPGVNIEKHYEELYQEYPEARDAWARYATFYDLLQGYFKAGRFFHHQDKGDLDLFKLFSERYLDVLQGDGWLVAIVNGGLYTAEGCKGLRKLYWAKTRWHQMLGFENRWPIFEGVDSRFKVAICIAQNGGPTTAVASFFMKHAPDAPYESDNRIMFTRQMLEELSGESLRFPEVQNEEEVAILRKAGKWPAFVPAGGWTVGWMRESDATMNRNLLTSARTIIPAIGGAEVHQFNPDFSAPHQFFRPDLWEKHMATEKKGGDQWQMPRLAFRRLARNTDERTGIAAVIPPGRGCVNTLWVEVAGTLEADHRLILQGILNSLSLDFLLRRRCVTDVTKEIMQSVPVPPPDRFMPHWMDMTTLVQRLEKSKGAYDKDRAKLDAIVAKVYGFTPEDLGFMWADFRVLAGKEPDYMGKVVAELEKLK